MFPPVSRSLEARGCSVPAMYLCGAGQDKELLPAVLLAGAITASCRSPRQRRGSRAWFGSHKKKTMWAHCAAVVLLPGVAEHPLLIGDKEQSGGSAWGLCLAALSSPP